MKTIPDLTLVWMSSSSVLAQVKVRCMFITLNQVRWYLNWATEDQLKQFDVVSFHVILGKENLIRVLGYSLNHHYSQIISAGEDGFIMRYDYIDDDTLAEWKNWTKDDL